MKPVTSSNGFLTRIFVQNCRIRKSMRLNNTFKLPDEDEPPRKEKIEHDLRTVRGTTSVYGVGICTTGGLGVSSLIKNRNSPLIVYKPLRIPMLNTKKIKRASAGFGFSLFASTTELFGTGLNNFYQIGGKRRSRKVRVEDNPEWFIYPRKIDLPADAGKIIDIASGRLHSLIATTNALFALGDNAHGQCGIDSSQFPTVTHNYEKELPRVELPEKSLIRKVHCCLDTSFVLMDNGNLYSFGLGTDGQLGHTENAYAADWRPTLVSGDLKGEKISRIAGSVDTLMAVSTSGELFIWGQNEYGQIPNEEEPQLFYPRHFPLANLGRLICAGSTGSSCVVCNDRGEVFTWGSVVLGFGPRVVRLERPMQIDPPLFASSVGNEGKVEWVYAGDTTMAAVTQTGQLFTWGVNRHGNLALGHPHHQHFPYQVSLPESVKNASFAPDHSLFVTRS